MNLFFNVLLYIFFISPINENDTELLFIGHAYGNPHAGNDEKIEPSLLTFLNNKDDAFKIQTEIFLASKY